MKLANFVQLVLVFRQNSQVTLEPLPGTLKYRAPVGGVPLGEVLVGSSVPKYTSS